MPHVCADFVLFFFPRKSDRPTSIRLSNKTRRVTFPRGHSREGMQSGRRVCAMASRAPTLPEPVTPQQRVLSARVLPMLRELPVAASWMPRVQGTHLRSLHFVERRAPSPVPACLPGLSLRAAPRCPKRGAPGEWPGGDRRMRCCAPVAIPLPVWCQRHDAGLFQSLVLCKKVFFKVWYSAERDLRK